MIRNPICRIADAIVDESQVVGQSLPSGSAKEGVDSGNEPFPFAKVQLHIRRASMKHPGRIYCSVSVFPLTESHHCSRSLLGAKKKKEKYRSTVTPKQRLVGGDFAYASEFRLYKFGGAFLEWSHSVRPGIFATAFYVAYENTEAVANFLGTASITKVEAPGGSEPPKSGCSGLVCGTAGSQSWEDRCRAACCFTKKSDIIKPDCVWLHVHVSEPIWPHYRSPSYSEDAGLPATTGAGLVQGSQYVHSTGSRVTLEISVEVASLIAAQPASMPAASSTVPSLQGYSTPVILHTKRKPSRLGSFSCRSRTLICADASRARIPSASVKVGFSWCGEAGILSDTAWLQVIIGTKPLHQPSN
ncbi:hypothetical protein BKA67DRAFT_536393 [Truncatella angustata]|uniref:Uncharacterized protein n=1 Tax=Truncatella angustata TaxID=152316 RepID=A0A9P8UID7_9PEZI|nr:uncharacterized protein BKA67DRAFT_536393 [Truncatella angustata]KAH6652664.1 hypothetical protein BKA67DRAFT_536393 [Truncatella angustata]